MGKIKLDEVNIGKLVVNDNPVINVGAGDGKIDLEAVHVAGVDLGGNLVFKDDHPLVVGKIDLGAVHVAGVDLGGNLVFKDDHPLVVGKIDLGAVHVAGVGLGGNLVFKDDHPLVAGKIDLGPVHVAGFDLGGNLVFKDDHPLMKIHVEVEHLAGDFAAAAVPIFADQNEENLHGEHVVLNNNNHPNDFDLIGSDSDSDIEG